MMFIPSSLLFLLVLIVSLLVVVSSPSWFGAWLGLEVNLMSFIPLMLSRHLVSSVESCIKYFLVQAFSSLLFLLSVLVMITDFDLIWLSKIPLLVLFITSLLIKLGAAPFHYWFPSVASGISWGQNFTLMTLQKVGPLFLLGYVWGVVPVFIVVVMLSTYIGGVGGLNQSSLRKLMAYSSINHLGWLLMALYFGAQYMLIYFLVYLVTNGILVLWLSSTGYFYLSQIYYYENGGVDSLVMFMNWLSFGGLPPFLGFFGKWVVIELMVDGGFLFVGVFMVFTSLVSLYYYTRICYVVFSQSSGHVLNFQGGPNEWAGYFFVGVLGTGLVSAPLIFMCL